MIILILAILLAVYFIYSFFVQYTEVVFVEANDKKKYKIRRGTTKSEEYLKESANMLADINSKVEKLIFHLQQKYKNDNKRNYFIRILKRNYNQSILSEAAIDNRYTTYTVDKKDMHICLRTRDKYEEIYDINVLMYVVLHELAHFCNYDREGNAIQGHGKEFRDIFKLLVSEAIEIGVYEYRNYYAKPAEYCGIIINTAI
jgi:predicted metal-dependent hydrolase